MRPRLLDLYCGAGGAGWGYHLAGFDVVGVDIARQPRYPFEFHQCDALEFLAEHGHRFAAVHASPPCQGHSQMRHHTGRTYTTTGLLADTLAALRRLSVPFVVENVPGSGPVLREALTLCGSSFGLGVRRHRHFVTSFGCLAPPCDHASQRRVVGVYGHTGGTSTRDGDTRPGVEAWREAMGIDWMTANELAQAIPPAYTRYLGEQLLQHVKAVAA